LILFDDLQKGRIDFVVTRINFFSGAEFLSFVWKVRIDFVHNVFKMVVNKLKHRAVPCGFILGFRSIMQRTATEIN
jgi:hypothetical protein